MNECKQEFCKFIGSKAFENDGGWSYEVWQAAQEAAFKRIAARFLGGKNTTHWSYEVAHYVDFVARSNGVSQDVPE